MVEGAFKIADLLLVYGPLGVICVLSLGVAFVKDRALSKERKSFLSKQEELAKQHKSEMQALEERYVSKSETWMTKYHELAHSMNSVMDALSKKRG